MKKILVLILLSSSLAFSQRSRPQYYGNLGFGFTFPNTNEINQILDYFNQTKFNLYVPFEEFGMLYGPDLEFGVIYEKQKSLIILEFGFSMKFSSGKTAKFFDSNSKRSQIDLSMRFPSFNLAGQYLFKAGKSFEIGAGVCLNIGSISIFSRSYAIGSSLPYYNKVGTSEFLSSVGFTPTAFINYKFSKKISLSVRPNYYIMLADQDLSSLNSLLNPGYAMPGINSVNLSGPGVAVNFIVKLGR